MSDGNFKNLIIDAYNKAKEGNGNLVGIIYSEISTYRFSELDIDEFVENSNPSMLYLKSKLTDTELDIYECDLEDYKVKNSESTIYVKLKNKMEVALMY